MRREGREGWGDGTDQTDRQTDSFIHSFTR